MADKETEAEWAKLRRIDAEKKKAAKALEEEKPDKTNLAFLEPKATKVKGFSNDKDVLLASLERYADRSFVFALVAVVLELIGWAGEMLSSVARFGEAAAIISGIPSALSFAAVALAAVTATVAIVGELYFKFKYNQKLGSPFWSAIFALPTIAIYFFLQWLIVFHR